MKKLFISLLLISIYSNSFSQDKIEDSKLKTGIFLSLGYSQMDFNNLNTTLKNYGYIGFNNTQLTYSFGSYIGNINRIHSSFEFYGYSQSNPSSTNPQSDLSGYGLSINLHYTAYKTNKLYITPYLGISLSTLTINLANYAGTGVSFDSSIVYLQGERNIYTDGIYSLNTGLSANYTIKQTPRNIIVGLRIGYQYQFKEPLWGVQGYEVFNGPKINTCGWYASLIFSIF